MNMNHNKLIFSNSKLVHHRKLLMESRTWWGKYLILDDILVSLFENKLDQFSIGLIRTSEYMEGCKLQFSELTILHSSSSVKLRIPSEISLFTEFKNLSTRTIFFPNHFCHMKALSMQFWNLLQTYLPETLILMYKSRAFLFGNLSYSRKQIINC